MIAAAKKKAVREFVWRRGFPYRGADPAKVVQELAALHHKNGWDKEQILAAARNRKSEMHKIVFSEADAVLAARERLHICAEIPNALKVQIVQVYITGERKVGPPKHFMVGWVDYTDRDDDGLLKVRRYIPVKVMRALPEAKREVLIEALRAAAEFRDRFEDLAELSGVFREIDVLLLKYEAMR